MHLPHSLDMLILFHYVVYRTAVYSKPAAQLQLSGPTSGEEPISMLDDGLDHAHNLKGQGGHHLCNVPEKHKERRSRHLGTPGMSERTTAS